MRSHMKKKDNEKSNQTVMKTLTQVIKYMNFIIQFSEKNIVRLPNIYTHYIYTYNYV